MRYTPPAPPLPPEPLWTLDDLAERWGIEEDRIRSLANDDRLPMIWIGDEPTYRFRPFHVVLFEKIVGANWLVREYRDTWEFRTAEFESITPKTEHAGPLPVSPPKGSLVGELIEFTLVILIGGGGVCFWFVVLFEVARRLGWIKIPG